jgi:hypothetical protein
VRRAYKEKEPVTEMAIVNTFTKLIFCEEAYTVRELSIIDAFQAMDVNVSSDSRIEMGEYLRNLGVREMIQLVSGLQQYLSDCNNAPSRSISGKPQHSTRPG